MGRAEKDDDSTWLDLTESCFLMAYNNAASKLERAVRAFLISQGKTTTANCYTMNGSNDKVLPNRVIGCVSFSPQRPYRAEGWVRLQIDHRFSGALDPNETDTDKQRWLIDSFLGDTLDSLMISDGNSLNTSADGITAAGRALATDPDPVVAADNSDMANFRCDTIKLGDPMHTRGKTDDQAAVWLEALHFMCFVSPASI